VRHTIVVRKIRKKLRAADLRVAADIKKAGG
jgi:hypothetical protein